MSSAASTMDAPVSLTQLPVVNVYDLTRRSENMAILKKGGHEELSSETVSDRYLTDSDLAAVEVEVNKKRRKKLA